MVGSGVWDVGGVKPGVSGGYCRLERLAGRICVGREMVRGVQI